MNKLFIVLPVLALLTLGVYYHHSDLMESATPLTIDQWQFCFQRLPNAYCDQLTDSTELSDCYGAANATSKLVWDGASNESAACVNWYSYFSGATAGDVLNQNNYYKACFANKNALAAAQQSSFYYNNIYGPKYITCAGLTA